MENTDLGSQPKAPDCKKQPTIKVLKKKAKIETPLNKTDVIEHEASQKRAPVIEPEVSQSKTPVVEPEIAPKQTTVIEPEPPLIKKKTVRKKVNKRDVLETPVIQEPTTEETKVANSENKKESPNRIEIVLDERERDLYEEIQKIQTDIPISKRVLTIGDILITNQENKPLLLIERKTLRDLLASIKDGRYTEQSYRLLNASGLPPHNILYCIEGMMNLIKLKEEKTRIYSALTSIHYYKGMGVLKTPSVQETAELIVRTAEKIQRESDNGKTPYQPPVVSGDEVNPTGGSYSKTLVSSVKSENITPENIGEIMLSQIPSVSIASARALLSKYDGDFVRFIEGLKNNDPILQQVYFVGDCSSEQTPVGNLPKKRKISGKCLENIRRLLFPQKVA